MSKALKVKIVTDEEFEGKNDLVGLVEKLNKLIWLFKSSFRRKRIIEKDGSSSYSCFYCGRNERDISEKSHRPFCRVQEYFEEIKYPTFIIEEPLINYGDQAFLYYANISSFYYWLYKPLQKYELNDFGIKLFELYCSIQIFFFFSLKRLRGFQYVESKIKTKPEWIKIYETKI